MGILQISVKPDPFRESEKINDKTNERLAAELEIRLKAFWDSGLTDGSSGTVRVAAEGNRLVITPTSQKDVVEENGLVGTGLSRSRQPSLSFGELGTNMGTFIDEEMRQMFEFDYPRFLDDSIRDITNENPSYSFDEEPI